MKIIDEKKNKLETCIENSTNKETINQLLHFDKNVPHWFLSPWFPRINNETNNQQKNRIYSDSKSFINNSLYALHKDFISINPLWISYLKSNSKLLKDYCYWNLALFLQTRNPNVPDIPNKLIKPAIRNGLTRQTNEYWKLVFKELGSVNCIFTDTKLYFDEKNFALDHFIPHNFVSHDLIWNLLPIERSFNSSKSDKLPIFEKHFDKFCELIDDINVLGKSTALGVMIDLQLCLKTTVALHPSAFDPQRLICLAVGSTWPGFRLVLACLVFRC